MNLPSIELTNSKLPKALDIPSVPLNPPSADVPVFPPIVIPPSNLKAPEGVEMEESEQEAVQTEQPSFKVPVIDINLPLPTAEVVTTATYAAVAAVATTTLATPFFDQIKKKVQKFLQGKIDAWKKQRQQKKDSLKNLKMLQKTKNTKSKSSEHSSDSE